MKIEGYLFALLFVFFSLSGGVYLAWSGDPSGGVPLYFSAGLGLIVATYLLYTSRRMDPRPEDRPDAEVEDGAGELGFFSPHSWWPLFLASGATIIMLGAIYGEWLILIGAIWAGAAVAGLVLEYYVKEQP